MARPLRLEFAGAVYHVTSRGDRREDIFVNDEDRQEWVIVLGLVCERFNWVVHAYCQMSNHYHLLLETPDGNLSAGMRQFNGQYTQRFNRRHGMVGHLFQGRYKAILIQKEAHLLELSRYVVLNPVRAKMVVSPEDWPWSSYSACFQDQFAPKWLDTDWLLGQFGTHRSQARKAYQAFVLEGCGIASPLLATRNQLILGDDAFVDHHQQDKLPEQLRELSLAHRRALALPLSEYQVRYADRDEAMYRAYRSGAYTMAEIATQFSVHYMTVSRAVRKWERGFE
jgi:putative transposase